MDIDLLAARSHTAPQQPDWASHPRLPEVRARLAELPPLVRRRDTDRLRGLLARVAAGEAQAVVVGDCAEDPAESGGPDVAAKSGLAEAIAGTLKMITRRPVVRAARIAGQYAKPRSRPVERVGGRDLPVYRGHMVNAPEPDPGSRTPDPERMLSGYAAAHAVMGHLGWLSGRTREGCPSVWTAHEALLLDYELALTRRSADGRHLLASTHWPWLGERTRAADGLHAQLLAGVVNPVSCKVGPTITPEELLALCERLDPDREPGRLTLTVRMGAGRTGRLPELVEAVRRAGHPVIWMSDPMHGNTVTAPSGLKTRFVEAIVQEVREFQAAVREAGGVPGGLHLETTPEPVTECVQDVSRVHQVPGKYTSFCDPRLNPGQATAVVAAWNG
ncbi:3-deoxy-7-phosphoheptulonate synthase [Streptomonospora sp. S1-112]|uniref:Phospho-2-dehydro-3-deoxyheptonate aldolase n=1 Tax=Streptomonospora mangrovi TaxID=2883123 RepID=A0A9X3NKX1_9ACTN|nr:3-deoxy-7-phosphoheptulonate synthase [Streptomonospora mangrovi]MDA0563941.1 3-deoxy-7-phosphoheptulonate synthase [Streptomonospora mangrovi]